MARQSSLLVVGAGFAGSTAARLLAEQGHKVRVIDQRSHVAGNAYDYVNDQHIRIHQYGPHIFHTSDARVWRFLSRFTDWVPYHHRVRCMTDWGDLVDFPPTADMIEHWGQQKILDVLYGPYTRKMWGHDIDQIDPGVLDRVRRRDPHQTGYFNDQWQCLPRDGYTQLISRMLDHDNITIQLNTAWHMDMRSEYDTVWLSMSIDQFHDYSLGRLPYRSLRFHDWQVHGDPLSDVPVVNFTTQPRYTRCTDWRLFPNQPTDQPLPVGTVTLEEPCDAADNNGERYYPVPDPAGHNRDLYRKYVEIIPQGVIFIGRCGLYSYLDMHQAVSSTQHRVMQWLHDQ